MNENQGKSLLPEKAFEQHTAILGKTGSGKTYAARGLVEHLLDRRRRVCIIDPKGDWWGLRLGASGTSGGWPVVIFGGARGDVPINGESGAAVAELVATGNRPAIMDLSELTIADRTRFFCGLAEGLFRHNRGPLWLVIDEVHNFAPQGKIQNPQAGMMLHWANRLASEGRGKGITLIMASQRPQKVHKDALTCTETLIAMRVVHPLDRAALKDWLDGAGDVEKSRKVLESLANMPRGQAWVWSPEIGHFERATVPKIGTFDSMSAAAGADAGSMRGWAEVDLVEVRRKLADVVAEAEANDPKALKRRVADLEELLRAANETAAAEPAVQRVEVPVDRPILREGELAELEAMRDRVRADIDKLHCVAGNVERAIASAAFGVKPVQYSPPADAEDIAEWIGRKATKAARTQIAERSGGNREHDGNGDGHRLNKLQRALLTALAQHPSGLSQGQAVILAGYRPSGDVSAAWGMFSRNGWIARTATGMKITEAGFMALGTFEMLPMGRRLRDYWLARCETTEAKILRTLFDHHAAGGRTIGQWVQLSGYRPSGDTSAAFGKFRRLNWITRTATGVKAADFWWEE